MELGLLLRSSWLSLTVIVCFVHAKLSHVPVTCAVTSEPLLETEEEYPEPDLQSVANPRFLEGLCTATTAGAFGGLSFAAIIIRMFLFQPSVCRAQARCRCWKFCGCHDAVASYAHLQPPLPPSQPNAVTDIVCCLSLQAWCWHQ